MFAVVNAVLFTPLPFADADRLMLVHLLAPDRETGTRREIVWSYPKYGLFSRCRTCSPTPRCSQVATSV